MTIWILALVLMASAAGLGHRQGVIRVAASLVGIPIAALLASPLAKLIKPVLKVLGMSHPILLSIFGPLLGFIIILSIFKSIGYAIHHKVDVFYRYKAGDLRFALWERLNARLGMCLGLVNGLMYLVLLTTVIYIGSYWTVQMATSDNDPKTVRILNKLGKDLQSSGMAKAAASLDKMPNTYYQAADVVGLIYHNPLLEARLKRYPVFLSLGERPELQALANDNSYTELLMRRAPIGEVLDHPRTKELIKNVDLLKSIREAIEPNLEDLRTFLVSGKSPKFDSEPLIGRWFFDPRASMIAYRKEKPSLPSSELQKVRTWMTARYSQVSIIATPDHQAYVKQFPKENAVTLETENFQGQWKKGTGDYTFVWNNGKEHTLQLEGTRMTVIGEALPLVFDKEE